MAVKSAPNVPDGWHHVRLGDVAKLGSGKTPRYDNEFGAIAILGSNGPIGLTQESNFSYGIAVGRVGASGSVQRIEKAVWLSDNVLFVDPSEAGLDLSFLCNALQIANLPGLASKTAQPLLTLGELSAVKILLPPLPEQRAIAAVLDSIDDAIEGADAVIAATGQLRDSLLHDLLTRGLPGQHTEFRDVPGLGTIPADWEVVRLGDVAEVQTGRAVKKGSPVDGALEVPYLSVANVKDGYLDLSVVKTMLVSEAEIERFSLKHGDVLFTEGGDADKLGRGTVWRTEISQCLHQNHVFAVRPHSDVLASEFLSFFAGSGLGKRYFLGAAKQTTNLASVNSSQLKDMPLPLPDIGEQKGILTALGRVGAALEVAREELAGLRLLKESTADALLTGRVRVGMI